MTRPRWLNPNRRIRRPARTRRWNRYRAIGDQSANRRRFQLCLAETLPWRLPNLQQIKSWRDSALAAVCSAPAQSHGPLSAESAGDMAQGPRLFVVDGLQQFQRIVCIKRHPSGEHLVQHHAQRVHIRSLIDFAAGKLLGCGVIRGTEERTGTSQVVGRGQFSRGLGLQLGDTEIQNLKVVALGNKYVLGFQVAVNNPRLVRTAKGRQPFAGCNGTPAPPANRSGGSCPQGSCPQ